MSTKRQHPVNIADLSKKLLKGTTVTGELRLCLREDGSACEEEEALPSSHRPHRQKFLEGSGAGTKKDPP
ncbi:hypothetical protein ACQRBR_09190, partial [Desulfovibrio sp. SGI.133]